jgi:hypothetical protein
MEQNIYGNYLKCLRSSGGSKENHENLSITLFLNQVVTRGNPAENLTLFCSAPKLISRAALANLFEQPRRSFDSGNVPVIVHIEILANGRRDVNRLLPNY